MATQNIFKSQKSKKKRGKSSKKKRGKSSKKKFNILSRTLPRRSKKIKERRKKQGRQTRRENQEIIRSTGGARGEEGTEAVATAPYALDPELRTAMNYANEQRYALFAQLRQQRQADAHNAAAVQKQAVARLVELQIDALHAAAKKKGIEIADLTDAERNAVLNDIVLSTTAP